MRAGNLFFAGFCATAVPTAAAVFSTKARGTSSTIVPPTSSMLPKVSAGGKAPEPEKFILSCVKHLEAVTGKILQLKKVQSIRRILVKFKTAVMVEDVLLDHSYTDVMVEDALVNECGLAAELPLAYEDGFKTGSACRHFAQEVTKARAEFLEQNDETGYVTVCRNYWTTTHAKHYRVRRQKPPHPTQLVWWWSLVIFSVGCLTVFVLNRNMKTRADFARLRGSR